MTTNYFKVLTNTVRPAEVCVPFDDTSPDDTARAWGDVCQMATLTKAKCVAAWRRPQCGGAWSKVEVVG